MGAAGVVGGPPSKRLAGGWIDDLLVLGKVIVFCDMCVKKVNWKRTDYVRKDVWPGQRFVMGSCDGCGNFCQGQLFVKGDFE